MRKDRVIPFPASGGIRRDPPSAGLDAFLMEIAASAPDMILSCAPDFTIASGNETASTWLGRRESAFLGRTIDDFLPGLSAELKARKAGPFVISGLRGCRHNGDSFPADVRGYASEAETGMRYLLFITNLAKRGSERAQPGAKKAVNETAYPDDLTFEKY